MSSLKLNSIWKMSSSFGLKFKQYFKDYEFMKSVNFKQGETTDLKGLSPSTTNTKVAT